MLSAYDYGQRALQKGRPNAFSHLTDFQKSLDFILEYVHIWEKWMKEKDVLIARYEDLLTDYDNEVARLVPFLKLNPRQPGHPKGGRLVSPWHSRRSAGLALLQGQDRSIPGRLHS